MSRKQTEQVRQFHRIIQELRTAQVHFVLSTHRDEALSILATVPGERWEIDVLDDGEVEFERFVSSGDIDGIDALTRCIADQQNAEVEAQD
jgi:hypothetical protein